MDRPFWQDESRHNVAILEAKTLIELASKTAHMSQPILEYAARWGFWFPIFGHQERGLRLPNFVVYLVLVISGVCLAGRFLDGRGHPRSYALLGSVLVAVWLSAKPDESWSGCVARHYSLVSLLSLWWFHLAMLAERSSPGLRWGVSLAFANTHFFALPLIGAASFLDAVTAWRERDRRGVAVVLVGAVAIAVVTIAINYSAWQELTGNPPDGRVAWRAGLLDGARTWWGFVEYAHLPVSAVVVWAGLLLVAGRRDVARLLLFVLVLLPLFLVALRIRSHYPFAPRYFTPFFGAAFATLVLMLDQGRLAFVGWLRRYRFSPAGGRVAGWAVVATMIAVFNVVPACRDLVRLRGAFTDLPENFSPTFRMYEAIKREDVPVLVFSDPCWNDVTPPLYLRFIGKPFKRELRQTRADGCPGGTTDIRAEMARFLSDHPRGLVVLDNTESGQADCGHPPAQPLGGGLRVTQAPDGLCAWFIRGGRNAADIRRAARAVEFRSLAWWYAR